MQKLISLISILLASTIITAQEKPEGLFINSKAPDFKATDQYGHEIRLKDVLKDSLVVLVFYRGDWSPYCIKYLKLLEDSLQPITNKRTKVIAITPEKPAFILKTIEKTKATFPIVYDKDLKIIKSYALASEIDERTVSRYKNADIDLVASTGQKDKIYLPIPAIYIIGKESTIVYRFFDTDVKKRASIQEIMDNLK